jgi:hypothetical protein
MQALTLTDTVLIGGILALIMNGVWPIDRALARAVRSQGGGMRRLLHRAHRENLPVMLSLDNRKTYVGWVLGPPDLRSSTTIALLPTLSGYRASETLTVKWTTDYSDVYEEVMGRVPPSEDLSERLLHFQVVVPFGAVASARFFDRDVYDRHFADPPSGAR